MPNTETGSYIKFLKKLSNIISPDLYGINILRQSNNNLKHSYLSKYLINNF